MGTFFELPDGKLVCFNSGGRFHGWLFRRHPDGQFVSVQKLAEVQPPLDSVCVGSPHVTGGENG